MAQIRVFAHFDLRLTAMPPTGVCKHIYQMVTGLAQTKDFEVTLLASKDQLKHGSPPHENLFAGFPSTALPVNHRFSRWLWEHFDFPVVDQYCADDGWIYCPMTLSVPVRHMCQATTFHGFPFFERHVPGYGSWPNRFARYRSRLQASKAVQRSQLLLAVSEYAKNELLMLTNTDPDRITVVGNGVDQVFFDVGQQVFSSDKRRPVFLAVGGLNIWDGADYLLNAARELARRAPEYELHVAGNQHDSKYIQIAREMPNVKLLGYVSSDELAQLMRQSSALWFLPNVESFGIAALEAMAVGLPVISSRLTGVPGTVGDAAWMVDVDQPSEIVEASLVLCNNSAMRAEYTQRGRERAALFTWGACVDRLADSLRKASR